MNYLGAIALPLAAILWMMCAVRMILMMWQEMSVEIWKPVVLLAAGTLILINILSKLAKWIAAGFGIYIHG